MTPKTSITFCKIVAQSLLMVLLIVSDVAAMANEKERFSHRFSNLFKSKKVENLPVAQVETPIHRAIMPTLYREIDRLVVEHEALLEKMKTQETSEISFKDYLIASLFPHRKDSLAQAGIAKDQQFRSEKSDIDSPKALTMKQLPLQEPETNITKITEKGAEELNFPEEIEAYHDQLYALEKSTQPEDRPLLALENRILPKRTVPQGEYDPAEERPLPLTDKIEHLLTTGDYYFLADNVDRARTYYIQAVEQGAKFKNSPLYARALVKLADIEENRYLARFQYSNALDIYEVNAKKHQEAIADILEKLVWTFDFTSERDEAFAILNRAKSIREARSYTPKYTETLRALAWFYEINNEFSKAEKHYQKAVELDLKHLTAQDIRTVLALENFAQFFIDYEQYAKAEKVLRLKLKEHLAITPPDYYNLGRTQSMLGWVLLQQGAKKSPLYYFNEALGNINYSLTKHRFIPHYYSLPALFDLIFYHTQNGAYKRAEIYFNNAKIILTEAGESDILDYLRYTEKQEITENGLGGFPWSLEAQVEGAQAMFEYLDYQKLTSELEALEAQHQSKIQILEALDNTHKPLEAHDYPTE